jgi:hypothetical protein
MESYENEIRIITMNHNPITITIPNNILIYMIDIDSLNFNLGYFFDIEVSCKDEILFTGSLGKNLKSINIFHWKQDWREIQIKMFPNFIMAHKFKKWLITQLDLVIIFNGYVNEPKINFSESNVLDEAFKEDWA